jgi:hypothetical protein
MPKKSRTRKTPARRNPFAPRARAMRAKVIPSKKTYRRKVKHPKKGAGGNGG